MDLRESFEPLLGNWAGAEEQSASPWAPAAATRAMIVFKLDLGGAAVVQDYRQVRSDGGEFTAHGVFMITESPAPIGWWLFDCYGRPPQLATGQWADRALVLDRPGDQGLARHTFRLDGERLIYRIEIRLAGEADFSQFLVGAFQRISGH